MEKKLESVVVEIIFEQIFPLFHLRKYYMYTETGTLLRLIYANYMDFIWCVRHYFHMSDTSLKI